MEAEIYVDEDFVSIEPTPEQPSEIEKILFEIQYQTMLLEMGGGM